MTFRQWLCREARKPNSPHHTFAKAVADTPEFDANRYYAVMCDLSAHSACDHLFMMADAAWDAYARAGYAPVENERDQEMREFLGPLLIKSRLAAIGCTYSGVKQPAGRSVLRADPACRARGAAGVASWAAAHYG